MHMENIYKNAKTWTENTKVFSQMDKLKTLLERHEVKF